jgi:hypothetical protein
VGSTGSSSDLRTASNSSPERCGGLGRESMSARL